MSSIPSTGIVLENTGSPLGLKYRQVLGPSANETRSTTLHAWRSVIPDRMRSSTTVPQRAITVDCAMYSLGLNRFTGLPLEADEFMASVVVFIRDVKRETYGVLPDMVPRFLFTVNAF